MSIHPKKPQLLPWLAKQAGIDEDRASALWLEAERWAEQQASPGSSACHKLAVDRMLELASAESLREDVASFGLRPWARAQAHFWTFSVRMVQQSAAVMARSWRLIGSDAEQQHRLG